MMAREISQRHSTVIAEHGSTPILNAAQQWTERCLVQDGSIFGQESLWTLTNLDLLDEHVVQKPDLGSGTFYEKLEQQLSNAGAPACRLMAELVWALLLFPSNISAETKRESVADVWGWSGTKLDVDHPFLADPVLKGIGSGGAGFNNNRWREVNYAVRIGRRVKMMDASARKRALTDYDGFITLIDMVPQEGRRQFRHMLRYLLFPGRVERMSSNGDRRRVLAGFGVATEKESKHWTDRQLDEALLKLRRELEVKYKTKDLDFYREPLRQVWSAEEDEELTADEAPGSHEVDEKPDGLPELGGRRVWIEIRRETSPAGSGWNFGEALWSPTEAKDGKKWYEIMKEPKPGDLVLHLASDPDSSVPKAFVAFSSVASQTETIDAYPPNPGDRGGQAPFFRIKLSGFRRFAEPLTAESLYEEAPEVVARETERENGAFIRYQNGFRTAQGKYLARCSEELYDTLRQLLSVAPSQAPLSTVPPSVIGAAFATAIAATGLVFGSDTSAFARDFIATLMTKPFVILTGLSGSGKTQLALKLGEWFGKDRFKIIAVRPDWTGPEFLLGFEDALRPEVDGRKPWSVPPALEFILAAASKPSEPFLLVLDEMNLAHVERYFADVLSGMESRSPAIPNLEKHASAWYSRTRAQIEFPRNLFIIGTVNVDETTYMFSPKVLDRANTIEFRVSTDALPVNVSEVSRPKACPAAPADVLASLVAITSSSSAHSQWEPAFLNTYAERIRRLHGALAPFASEFGHRTYYEGIRLASLLHAVSGADLNHALDIFVIQRILPRLHGSRRKLEPVLKVLVAFAFTGGVGDLKEFDPAKPPDGAAALPRSFAKLSRMTASLHANQFASFAE